MSSDTTTVVAPADPTWRMARAVQSGNLSVNSHSSVRVQTSFGGMKQSGFGRELGLEALSSSTDVKNVFVAVEG